MKSTFIFKLWNLFSYSILSALDRNIDNIKMPILRAMVMLESWGYLEVGLSPTLWRIGDREPRESHALNQSKRVPIWFNYRFILRKINWSPIDNKESHEIQSVNYLNLKFTKTWIPKFPVFLSAMNQSPRQYLMASLYKRAQPQKISIAEKFSTNLGKPKFK